MEEKYIDINSHPIYKDYNTVDWIKEFLERYGQFDGGHHKAWVLDQIARISHGTPVKVLKFELEGKSGEKTESYELFLGESSKEYKAWVKKMRGKKIDGEYEYDYDEGIAP